MAVRLTPLIAALIAPVSFVAFAGGAAAQEKITYDDHVQQLLVQHCGKCHGEEKQKAGLDVSSYSSLMRGSSGGPVVASGDPDRSVIYLAVTHRREPTMPLGGGKIPDAAIEMLRKWIEGGLLESSGSAAKPKKKANPALAAVVASIEKPAEPPPLPEDLLLEPAVVTPRPGAIVSLASNPWAPLVALGGRRQVVLYDTRSLELLGILPFPEGLPHALSFTRDGRLLVAGGGKAGASGRVVAWNVQTGQRLFELGEESDAPLAAELSSDRRFVALGGSDKVVKVLASETGELVHKLKKHTEWITALAFSPDGVLLATGDRNGGLVVWESQSGREYQTLAGPRAAITAVAWRDDANVLVSASEDGTVRLHEMAEGRELKNFAAHPTGVLGVTVAHDGRIATCGRDKTVKLWSADGQPLRTFEPMDDVVLAVAFDADGGRVIAGDWTGAVRVWSAADGARVGTLALDPPRVDDRLAAAQSASDSAQRGLETANAVRTSAEEAARPPIAELAAARAAADPVALTVRVAEGQLAAARSEAEAVAAALTEAAKELDARRAEADAHAIVVTQLEQATAQADGELHHAEQVEADRRSLAAKMAETAAAMRAASDGAPDDAELKQAAASADEAAAKTRQSQEMASQALAAAATRRDDATRKRDEARAKVSAVAGAVTAAETKKSEQSARIGGAGAKQADAEASLQAAKSELAPLEQEVARRAEAAKPLEATLAAAQQSAEQAAAAAKAAQRDLARWRAARVNLDLHDTNVELAAAEVLVAAKQAAVEAARAPFSAIELDLHALQSELAASPERIAGLEQERTSARASADAAASSVEPGRARLNDLIVALRGHEAFHGLLAARSAKRPADSELARLVKESAQKLAQTGEVVAAARADVAKQEEAASAAERQAAEAAQRVAAARARAEKLPELVAARHAELEAARSPLVVAEGELAAAAARRDSLAARAGELAARYAAEKTATR